MHGVDSCCFQTWDQMFAKNDQKEKKITRSFRHNFQTIRLHVGSYRQSVHVFLFLFVEVFQYRTIYNLYYTFKNIHLDCV